MKIIGIGALALLSCTSLAAPVWYNGNDDNLGGFAALTAPNGFGNSVFTQYEDFTWNSASNAGSIMGTMVASVGNPFSQLNWEIRQGMDFGTSNSGTLIASGTSTVNLTFVSNWSLNTSLDVYTMTGDISSTALTNGGSYFLGFQIVSPNSTFTGGITTTSGAGGIGSPLNNDNAFSVNGTGGFGLTGQDLSMGIGTAVVPEPATFAVLGLGAVALLRRRRK
jgi:PEP-CTERM motif